MMAIKKKKRVSKKSDGAFSEPKFDDFVFNTEELMDLDDDVRLDINTRISKGLNFYNYHYSSKHSKQPLILWLKDQKVVNENEIKAIQAAKDWQVGITTGSVARMLNNGCPAMDNLIMSLKKKVKEIVEFVEILQEK